MSWAKCTLGHVHWGPRGAAGLLVADGGSPAAPAAGGVVAPGRHLVGAGRRP